jgi:hypothetical protein
MKKVKLPIIVAGIVLLAVCTGVVVMNRGCVYLPLEKAYFEDGGTLYGVSQSFPRITGMLQKKQ